MLDFLKPHLTYFGSPHMIKKALLAAWTSSTYNNNINNNIAGSYQQPLVRNQVHVQVKERIV